MLRGNLSTRPFYNVRAVHVALAAAVVLVLAVTLFNVAQALRLTASQESLGVRAEEAEAEAERLRGEAARIRAEINPDELEVVAGAAREANVIIDQRAFSWTELFAQFETTLPPDVRVTAVRPRLERDGRFVVSVGAQARRAEDLDAFIEALEDRGAFENLLSVTERTADNGLIEAVIEGAYVARARATSPPGGTGGD